MIAFAPRAAKGFGLALGVVCVSILVIVGGALIAIVAREARFLDDDAARRQADWLAEAGIERAVAQLAEKADYPGESWLIPSEELGGIDAARVEIVMESEAKNPARRLVKVSATYPIQSAKPHQAHRQINIDLSRLKAPENSQ